MIVKDVVEFMNDNNFDELIDSDVDRDTLELNKDSEVIYDIYEVTTDEAETMLYFVDSVSGEEICWGIISNAFVTAEFIHTFDIDFTYKL